MKVLLIAPDYGLTGLQRPAHGYRPLFPPLSLLQVAAATPPEIEVRLIDENVEPLDFDWPSDLVGITCLSASAPRAYEIAAMYRARGKPVVLGGIHPTALPEEAIQHADAVVVGEAEGSWPRLLEDSRQGRMEPIYRSSTFPDLTDLPAPRRELMRPNTYLVSDTIQSSRGCVFDCGFCSVTTFFGRTLRTRPVERVVQEASGLRSKLLVFVDDNIMGKPAYSRRLFEGLRGSGKRWFGQASLTMLQDINLLKLAARAGCRAMFIGLESLSDVALRKMGKGFNLLHRYQEGIKRIHDCGIAVVGAFMFGFDSDDSGVFERTVDFTERARVDLPQFSVLTPLPGTRVWREMEEQGRILDRDWSHYDGGHVVFQPSLMTPEELEQGFKGALARAYSMRSIFRRVFGLSPRALLMMRANQVFRERAIPFARTASAPVILKG